MVEENILKLHNFILKHNSDKGCILYNPINEAILLLPREIEELDDESNELLISNYMLNLGDDSSYFGKTLYNRVKYSDRKVSLIIHTNYTCNLSCSYCYQKGLTDENEIMGEEVIKQLYGLFQQLKKKNHLEALDLSFIGGEPLLFPNTIMKIYDMAREVFEDILITSSLITNGLLLVDSLNLLKHIPFDCIQITIDGGEKTHNLLRKRKDGKGSYKCILENLVVLQKNSVRNVVINYNLSVKSEGALEELLKDLKKQNIKYPLIFSVVFSGEKNECAEDVILLKKQSSSWLNAHLKSMEYGYSFPPFYRNSRMSCGYYKENSFCIAPDGMMFKCISGMSMDEYRLCHITKYDTMEYYNRLAQMIETRNMCRKAESVNCEYTFVCDGGCLFKSRHNGWKCQANEIKEEELELLYKYVCNITQQKL